MFSPSEPEPSEQDDISDQEWEIRTGRAIYILQQTLPKFFHLGLVAHIDPSKAPVIAEASGKGDVESIYSAKVRLLYTPPVPLPSPFPRTLHIEGLPLYMASSVFIRHTMKTLYSDLHVTLRKMTVQSAASSQAKSEEPYAKREKNFHRREKSLFVSLCVTGTTRVSGGRGQWEIDSTYGFSPISGLIHTHTINSIQPAPHQAVYDTLRSSLMSVFGISGGEPGTIRPEEVRVSGAKFKCEGPARKYE
ncbi:hypothetical protein SERLA73DRAFT_57671 [Serpula lacrymans var. lacrymans S7.3]|uniref:Uncharacterized protein n=2 Tax=Serpula lacrymans var. lacrymans TaxID=341189 RepID=F8Q3N7_SERL3|nr:hypothetical protein SERLA73DRAFT_57671 [Serpula lacrymans var. lacrymans S7.3]